MGLPNFTFVVLPDPENLGGTLKILESHDPGHAKFLKKRLLFSLVPAKTCTKFLVYSFVRSKDITPNRMHVFACEMPEMHPKIVFWGFRVEKFNTLMLKPPRKSVPGETRRLVQKLRR